MNSHELQLVGIKFPKFTIRGLQAPSLESKV